MAETTSRIEATTSYREPDRSVPQRRGREKPRPKSEPADDLADLAGPEELDDQEKHSLDTLA